jgi:hypothetical protein
VRKEVCKATAQRIANQINAGLEVAPIPLSANQAKSMPEIIGATIGSMIMVISIHSKKNPRAKNISRIKKIVP